MFFSTGYNTIIVACIKGERYVGMGVYSPDIRHPVLAAKSTIASYRNMQYNYSIITSRKEHFQLNGYLFT